MIYPVFPMKFATLLFVLTLACALQRAAADESFQGAVQRSAAVHPSLYSFSDLYRLAVASAVPGGPLLQPGDAPVRTAVAAPAAQFAISDVREPQLGALLLSGLALALWVARRRLGYAF
jgi:hypothetical protein